VTGDANNVTIRYTAYGDGISNSQESATTLSWTKELQANGLLKGGSLTVTADADGGTVACKVGSVRHSILLGLLAPGVGPGR
jgi:hypothetical protein